MTAPGESLTPAQEMAVLALLSCPTLCAAAARVHVSERTVRRWLKEPAFARALAEARREAFGLAMGRLQRAANRAVTALVKGLKAEKSSDRIRAATAILRAATAGAEALDLESRVSELEQRAPKTSGGLNGHHRFTY
jgi:hypothetical protein